MVTVRYPVSDCFCITAEAIELRMVKLAGPDPLLVTELPKPPMVPDHAVSLSMHTMKVSVFKPESTNKLKLFPQ